MPPSPNFFPLGVHSSIAATRNFFCLHGLVFGGHGVPCSSLSMRLTQNELQPHHDLNAALASKCIPAIWLYIAGDVPAAAQSSFLRAAETFFGLSFSSTDMCTAIASKA